MSDESTVSTAEVDQRRRGQTRGDPDTCARSFCVVVFFRALALGRLFNGIPNRLDLFRRGGLRHGHTNLGARSERSLDRALCVVVAID